MNVDSWLTDTIYVASTTGTTSGGYGKPDYAAPRVVMARVEENVRLLPANINEQQWNDRIDTIEQIKKDDKIWLPGVDQTDESKSKRPILITSAKQKGSDFRLWETFL